MAWLIDTTLRDGEQAPGVSFSRAQKVRLAKLLNEVGVEEIEAGIPAMGDEETNTIRDIVHLGLKVRVLTWSRALKKDIEQAARTGSDAIHIAFPLSDIQLSAMNKDWQWVKDSLPEITDHARRYFRYVSVGAQDAGRCPPGRLDSFVGMAAAINIFRVRIADTVGVMMPTEVFALVSHIREAYPQILIDFHAHNDLGMATANAVTALQAGASAVSVTVNGLGERCGNAALEEVIMALKVIDSKTAATEYKYNTALLYDLCRYVADISGRDIPQGKPVCGEMAFSHESGIHATGTLNSLLAYQPFDGRDAGRESHRTLFGKHSGIGILRRTLEKHNIILKENELELLKERISQEATAQRRNITEDEVCFLANSE